MDNCYVRSSIAMLNNKTQELKNLDELGIYLAKQPDANALQILKLIILASENDNLLKNFHIDSVKKYKVVEGKDTYKRQETITNNLANNPQYLGLELMEFILHNYNINLQLTPYDSDYTIFDFWLRSFITIEYRYDKFYKRYDMINKRIDMVSYMIENNLIDDNDIADTVRTFETCLDRKYNYTKEQLFRMKEIVDSINYKKKLTEGVSKLVNDKQISLNCSKEEILNRLIDEKKEEEVIDRGKFFFDELRKYEMTNDDCIYIYYTIPTLIKKKIIK